MPTGVYVRSAEYRAAQAERSRIFRSEHKYKSGLKHGMHGTPTYKTWENMISRCNNPKAPNYSYYGGRGITVCERWLKFANFFADMGVRPEELTLDRKDNDGNYEPDNCHWATKKEQFDNSHLINNPTDGRWVRD